MNISWDAKKYEKDFSFVHQYGEDVLNLITLPESDQKMLAIDLGCGNGALSEKLKDMGFSAIGIDDSEDMLFKARSLHPSLTFQKGNAIDFQLEEKADVIFSNAVFHWIDESKQEIMAKNLYSQLKDQGQLVCEFGGKGCAEAIHSTLEKIFRQHGSIYPRVFYFPTIGEYASILENAGFRVEEAYLFDRPTKQNGEDGLKDWINMFVKKPFEGMDLKEKDKIIEETVNALKNTLYKDGHWYIDYVRIRIKAVKVS